LPWVKRMKVKWILRRKEEKMNITIKFGIMLKKMKLKRLIKLVQVESHKYPYQLEYKMILDSFNDFEEILNHYPNIEECHSISFNTSGIDRLMPYCPRLENSDLGQKILMFNKEMLRLSKIK
jgi:hypothetical protein